MIDTSTPRSPGWWLARLSKRIEARRAHYSALDSYYTGAAMPPHNGDRALRESYQRLCQISRLNFAELIVEAVRERMVPTAFRTALADDQIGDSEAWDIWQRNSLDADSALVHRASLSMGMAYVIVGGFDDSIGAPLITPEDPREVIVEHDPRHRRRPLAALKLFRDDVIGADVAYLYLPGVVYRVVGPSRENQAPAFDPQTWRQDGDPQVLPARIVPVTAFGNKLDLAGRHFGEFEGHTGHLDRINHQVMQRIEIASLQAFRQRAIKGLPTRDEHGDPIDYADIFAASPGALWHLPAAAELWESGQVDLGPVRMAIRDDEQDLCAVSRTPLHYLAPDAANGSAEGASLAREGLVAKTRDRLVQAGESWERVMRYAFLMRGDEARAAAASIEVAWADPERHSLAERYDAASKAIAAGVPWRSVMLDVLGFSPQQVDQMEALRLNDQLFAASLVLPAPAAAPAGTTPQPTPQPAAASPSGMTAAELAQAANALGQLIRSGVRPESAAAQVGLEGVEFTGAVPVSLRLPETEAQQLEGS